MYRIADRRYLTIRARSIHVASIRADNRLAGVDAGVWRDQRAFRNNKKVGINSDNDSFGGIEGREASCNFITLLGRDLSDISRLEH